MTFHLTSGTVISCGCYNEERSRVHGTSGTPEYKAWVSARRRCREPGDKAYPRYGGRGIRMHEAWIDDPGAFIAHVGPRPSPDHSIDRIDVNGHYEPGNVRWATRFQQGCNKRNSRMLEVRGEAITVPDAARKWGVPAVNIRNRLKRGWPDDQAVGASPRTSCEALKTS